jgi:hypothetical protein
MDETPIIQEFLTQAVATRFELVGAKTNRLGGIASQEVQLKIIEDRSERAAFATMYVISRLSFLQGRPYGSWAADYVEDDDWSLEDFLRHLSIVGGKLHFFADRVRGRVLATAVEISEDGTVMIKTVDRGNLANHWAYYLHGKTPLPALIGQDGPVTVH